MDLEHETPLMKAMREFAMADPDDCDQEWAAYLALVKEKETPLVPSSTSSTSALPSTTFDDLSSSASIPGASTALEDVSPAAPTTTEVTTTSLLQPSSVLALGALAPANCSTECSDIAATAKMLAPMHTMDKSATSTTVMLEDTKPTSISPDVSVFVCPNPTLDAAHKLFDEKPLHADVDLVASLQLNTGKPVMYTATGPRRVTAQPILRRVLDIDIIGIDGITKLDIAALYKADEVEVLSTVKTDFDHLGDELRPLPWPSFECSQGIYVQESIRGNISTRVPRFYPCYVAYWEVLLCSPMRCDIAFFNCKHLVRQAVGVHTHVDVMTLTSANAIVEVSLGDRWVSSQWNPGEQKFGTKIHVNLLKLPKSILLARISEKLTRSYSPNLPGTVHQMMSPYVGIKLQHIITHPRKYLPLFQPKYPWPFSVLAISTHQLLRDLKTISESVSITKISSRLIQDAPSFGSKLVSGCHLEHLWGSGHNTSAVLNSQLFEEINEQLNYICTRAQRKVAWFSSHTLLILEVAFFTAHCSCTQPDVLGTLLLIAEGYYTLTWFRWRRIMNASPPMTILSSAPTQYWCSTDEPPWNSWLGKLKIVETIKPQVLVLVETIRVHLKLVAPFFQLSGKLAYSDRGSDQMESTLSLAQIRFCSSAYLETLHNPAVGTTKILVAVHAWLSSVVFLGMYCSAASHDISNSNSTSCFLKESSYYLCPGGEMLGGSIISANIVFALLARKGFDRDAHFLFLGSSCSGSVLLIFEQFHWQIAWPSSSRGSVHVSSHSNGFSSVQVYLLADPFSLDLSLPGVAELLGHNSEIFQWIIAWFLKFGHSASACTLKQTFFQPPSAPQQPDCSDTCGILLDHHRRMGFVIHEVLRYNPFSAWTCFGVGLVNGTILQAWLLSWFLGHILHYGFELLHWKLTWSFNGKCSEIASTNLKDLLLPHMGEENFEANFIVVSYWVGRVAAWYMCCTSFRATGACLLLDNMKHNNRKKSVQTLILALPEVLIVIGIELQSQASTSQFMALLQGSKQDNSLCELSLPLLSVLLPIQKVQLSWDPSIWELLGFPNGNYQQVEAKRRATTFLYLAEVHVDHDYYLDGFLDKFLVGHKYYLNFDQVCADNDYCIDLVQVHPDRCYDIDHGYHHNSGKIKESQVPWDPGGSMLPRLGVKPKIKWEGMSAVSYSTAGPSSGAPLGPGLLGNYKRGALQIEGRGQSGRGARTKRLRPWLGVACVILSPVPVLLIFLPCSSLNSIS